ILYFHDMIGLASGTISLCIALVVLGLSRKVSRLEGLVYFLPLIVPLSAGITGGFSPPVLGLSASLVLLTAVNLPRKGGKAVRLSGFLIASLLFSLIGFRIQFIQMAPSGSYVYFTWLSIPLTVIWLFLISRSVEFTHYELGRKKWRLFIITLLAITFSFLTIVALQGEQNLGTALQLGSALVGGLSALLIVSPKEGATSIISSQLGFILAGLALIGVVKSLTAFVLLAPIAPLILPNARRSLAFTRATTVTSTSPNLINRLIKKYAISYPIGIVFLYVSLSFLGLASAWFVWNPGIIQGTILGSGILVLPSLLTGVNKVGRYLQSWNPSISGEATGTVNIFGTKFNFGDLTAVKKKLSKLTRTEETNYIATPDVTAVIQAEQNEFLASSFARADVVTPDGFGLIWASSVHDLPLKDRVAGIDLIDEILSTDQQLDIYLLGSKPGVAEKAGIEITNTYDKVDIVGTHHGYIPVDSEEAISEINESNPDLLFVGMGVPKQEEWIMDNLDKIEANVVMGVGGSFDVISGNLPRAPRWMRERGLEWLYRIWLEPGRLGKARLIPYFMSKVLWEKIKLILRNEIL
ncbi:WecB/TagA/CpsF family glycosyltransferase, partial [Candidatus Bipolaricaulota bacterium]|nr:WecB/TagA/CpsF family glycosyltransferase [Candidatus Bipolaricaulota bacterium]